MARRRSVALTDGELRIMRVLWERRRATVGEMVDALDDAPRPAYNTVLTIMRILERKGYLAHEKAGRAHVYRPLVDRAAARRQALTHLLTHFFDGSAELLVLDLLGRERLDPEDARRVRDLIGTGTRDTAGGGRRRDQDAAE